MTAPLYRAVIEPEGPLASALHGDTLFGAFCWSWLRRYGRDALEAEIIVPSLAGAPPVIFSNGFPRGGLPLPMGCYDRDNALDDRAGKEERRDAYRRGKRLKNARYISRDAFRRIQRGDWRGFTGSVMGEPGEEETTMHNLIDRESGGSGGLFGSSRRFFAPGEGYDVYILSGLPRDRLETVLELMFSLGVGADKSAGCGLFRLAALEEDGELMTPPDGANGFVALANFIPAAGDPAQGRYKTLPKYPKLDRELAGADVPFKKPLLFLTAGSLFYARPLRPWYGRCVAAVAAVAEPVIVNGCTAAVPMTIPADGL